MCAFLPCPHFPIFFCGPGTDTRGWVVACWVLGVALCPAPRSFPETDAALEPQDILSRLDSRKTTLMREVTEINVVMAALAKANVGNDRGMVSEAMEAAVRIFSKVDDMYPKVGSPSPWTMDKQKKKNKGKF